MSRPLNIFISHPSHFLTDSQPHGDGLIADSILRRLADRGHNLHVAVSLSSLQCSMPSNVRLYPIQTRVPHTKNDQGFAYRAEYAIRVRRLFTKIRRSTSIDVIHQMNPVVGGLSFFLQGLGYPVIMGPIWPPWRDTRSSESSLGRLRSMAKTGVRRGQFARADGILCPTPESTATLPERIRRSPRVFPFHLGIDTGVFSPVGKCSAKSASILFLANLQERKGVFVLLSAFEKVVAQMPSAKLILAGTGGQAEEVKRRVQESASRANIEMPGNILRSEVPAALRSCTVYCLPSFGEPYGMSAMEAMACGKPLVVTNSGGLGHLVPDQGSLKVPPRDVEALGAALLTLLEDAELRRTMSIFNRRYVEEYHSWDRVIDELEGIYELLIRRVSNSRLKSMARYRPELVG